MESANFFGAVQAMMNRLQSQILTTFQTVLPLETMMNLIWTFIGAIFLWYFMEATYTAFSKGTPMSIFAAYWDLIRKRWLRLVVYGTMSLGTLILLNGGSNLIDKAQGKNAWANVATAGGGDLVHDFGFFIVDWTGSNATVDTAVTNADGTTTTIQQIKYEAPVLNTLRSATVIATNAINGMSATQTYNVIDTQIDKALNKQVADSGFRIPTDVTLVVLPLLDGIFWVFNWFTFVWAQWTLTRTLLIQTLFLQMSWHLGLYFLPLFILMAYFRSMQGFLTNLLTNYFAMMVAGYVMASVALVLFSPGTWIGTQAVKDGPYAGGIVQMAFEGLTLGVNPNGSTDPGMFPWVARTYMKQVARGQLVWLLGACGLILGQVYDLVRGILGGSFRANFQAGGAGAGTSFGGK